MHGYANSFPTNRSRKIRVWDLPLRLFDWLLVAAIALAFLSSEAGSPRSDWHIASGWAAALLIGFRVVWGFVGGEHSRRSDFVRPSRLASHLRELARFRPEPTLGHNPLGALSVLLLLALAAAVVWTGAVLGEAGEEVHELLAWTLLGLVALHVLAVVLMSALTRENLARAMVTGRKRADRHPDARDARRPTWYGLLFAAIALLAALLAILSYDPRAFEPRPAEAQEAAEESRSDRETYPIESHERAAESD